MRRSLTVLVVAASISFLIGASPAAAADSPVGTWVKKGEGHAAMTLTIDEWGPNKVKLTWRMAQPKMVLTLVAALDGSEAPLLIDGKPSGETMAIKRIDNLHTAGTVKMNG